VREDTNPGQFGWERGFTAVSPAAAGGRVDTILPRPYIFLFDPAATPVTRKGRRRLSRPFPPPKIIRRNGIVSTGFPGPQARSREPGRGAEGVVENGDDRGGFVRFFRRFWRGLVSWAKVLG
jgi:hypothetical protein